MSAPAAPLGARLVPHAVALAFGLGITASLVTRPGWPWWSVAPVVVIGVIGVGRADPRRAAAVLVACVAILGWWWGGLRLGATDVTPIRTAGGVAGVVEVADPPVAGEAGARAVVRVVSLHGAEGEATPAGARLFLVVDAEDAATMGHGVRRRVRGTLRPAASTGDPAWWRAYVERRGIVGTLRATSVDEAGRRGGAGGVRDRARDALGRAVVRGLSGDRAAIVRGMAFGGGAGLSDATRTDMRDAGIWHLMAVSGQNITYVSFAVVTLLVAAGIRRRRAAVIGAVAVIGYCLMCDGGASVGRAGVVGVLVVVAGVLSNPADRWYLTIVALDILLAVQPRSIDDPGLQLSFAAVVGLLTLTPPLAVWLSGLMPKVVADLAAQALAASLATAPVTVLRFETLSLAGLVANLVAVPLAAPTVVLATAGAAVGALAWPLGVVPVWCAGLGADAIRVVGWSAARLPGATVRPGWIGVAAAVAVAGGVVWARWWLWTATPHDRGSGGRATRVGMPRRTVAVAVALAVLVAGVVVRHRVAGRPVWPAVPSVTMLDVGQGDATLFRSPDGRAMLVDTGPPGDPAPVVARLRRMGVRRLDLVVLTHRQQDHDGALDAVREAFDVVAVARAGARGRGANPAADAALGPGDRITLGSWRAEVLWPPDGTRSDDPNRDSVVMVVRAPGVSVLVGGDAESDVLRRAAPGRVDVLKVAHHGSADPQLPGLLRTLRPRVAVVSVGAANPYGHPDAGTMRALDAAAVRVWRTDRDGSVEVRPADRDDLTVRADG